MFYLIIYLLLTTAIFFSNPSLAKTDISEKQPIPLTLRTTTPPLISYATLKYLRKAKNWNVSTEEVLLGETITIGISQTRLSNSTAEKIARFFATVMRITLFKPPGGRRIYFNLPGDKKIKYRCSTSRFFKTLGTTFIRELLFDEIPYFFNTGGNIPLQSGKLVVKSLGRHLINDQFIDFGSWYPERDLHIHLDNWFDDNKQRIQGILAYFTQRTLVKFTEEKLVQITGKNTYLSIRMPLIIANDLAVAAIESVTSTFFEKNAPQITAEKWQKGLF